MDAIPGSTSSLHPARRRGRLFVYAMLAAALLLSALLVWVPGRLVLARFQALEQTSLARDLDRVVKGYEQELGALRDLARDWGSWDDAYRFMAERDPAFIQSNLDWRSLLQVSRLHLMAFRDAQGSMIWQGYRVDERGPDLPFPAYLKSPGLLQEHPMGFEGLVLTPQGPLMVVARPVLPSKATGVSRGILIMGRLLGEEQQTGLRQRTSMALDFRDTLRVPLRPTEGLALDPLRQGPQLILEPERILATLLIPELASPEGLLITVTWPREIFLHGHQASRGLSATIALSLLIIGSVLLVGFRRYRALLKRSERDLAALVAVRTAELHAANRALEDTSMRDPLTQLNNRRYISATLPSLTQRSLLASQSREPGTASEDLVFLLLDLDHFKAVNDLHGHAAGDAVLVQVGELLRSCCRETDTVARWGGEEFLLVAQRTQRSIAPRLARVLVETLQGHAFHLPDGGTVYRTCSVGWCAFPFPPGMSESLSWEQVVELADLCLYAAKRSGRNGWVGVECPTDTDTSDLMAQLPGGFLRLVAEGRFTIRCSWDDPSVLEWH